MTGLGSGRTKTFLVFSLRYYCVVCYRAGWGRTTESNIIGVAFSVTLLEWGHTFSLFWDEEKSGE